MGKIKNVGVGIGIAVGSVLGGTVSFIGKMADKKELDRLGENIMDSTILTGEIAGGAASGVTQIVSGTLQKRSGQVEKGKRELAAAGECVLENAVENMRNVANQGEEILAGLKTHDRKRINRGLCTLGKMIAVGALTVGAVKVDSPDNEADLVDEPAKPDAKKREKPGSAGTEIELKTEIEPETEMEPEPEIKAETGAKDTERKMEAETDHTVSEEELEKIIRF